MEVRDSTRPGYFDVHARKYQETLDSNLALIGETGEAFVEYRMNYLRRRLPLLPRRVLDFGCGIGMAIPHLLAAFPGCEVVGVDVSEESVKVARSRLRDDRARVTLNDDLVADGFDLAYASGVFHHIESEHRLEAARYIFRALRPGGVFVLAEHNPWNPVTRLLVRTCAFDEGVQLLRPKVARRLLEDAGFNIWCLDFVGFFAGPLRSLRSIERHLAWSPVGAQYIVLARREQ
ncbi:MAG TPA: class I SAM-dependent methyltransferase [Candidatus Dormibacteraeota bacterium]|nr:class I SAM-dependent methyltransferase [Candidatus Dormibacteraeota bacterium]